MSSYYLSRCRFNRRCWIIRLRFESNFFSFTSRNRKPRMVRNNYLPRNVHARVTISAEDDKKRRRRESRGVKSESKIHTQFREFSIRFHSSVDSPRSAFGNPVSRKFPEVVLPEGEQTSYCLVRNSFLHGCRWLTCILKRGHAYTGAIAMRNRIYSLA